LSIRPFLSLNFVNLFACSVEILCRSKKRHVLSLKGNFFKEDYKNINDNC
jgi:hypothetical protein